MGPFADVFPGVRSSFQPTKKTPRVRQVSLEGLFLG